MKGCTVTVESLISLYFDTADAELTRNLAAIARVRTCAKGSRVINAGDVQTQVNVLVSGGMRSFFIDQAGREVTDCLMLDPVTPVMPSARFDVASPTTIEALFDSVVLSLDLPRFMALLDSSLPLALYCIRMLQNAWGMHWEVQQVVAQLRADERYRWFCEKRPGLIDQIPNRYIASYLGMSPVTLSRIRSAERRG